MRIRAYVIAAFVFAAFFGSVRWPALEMEAGTDFVPADHIPAGVLGPYPPLSSTYSAHVILSVYRQQLQAEDRSPITSPFPLPLSQTQDS
jgi:hypothetical protein